MGITDQAVLHVTQRNTTTENQTQGHKTKRGFVNDMLDWVETVVSYELKSVFETKCSFCVFLCIWDFFTLKYTNKQIFEQVFDLDVRDVNLKEIHSMGSAVGFS